MSGINRAGTTGSGRPLRVGLFLSIASTDASPSPWSKLLGLAEAAVESGFDSLWLADHMLLTNTEPELRTRAGALVPDVEEVPVGYWECCAILAALAARLPDVELGSLVICTGYRNPALLAKIAETLDEISGGRLILGLGSGDSSAEHATFGYATDHLVGRFEEALAIIRGLLREGRSDFDGDYYRVENCELRPRGPRSTGLPILIGTFNPGPRMQRLIAQYADVWNAWLAYNDNTPQAAHEQVSIIEEACLRHGRDPSSLVKTAGVQVSLPGYEDLAFSTDRPITGSIEEIAEVFRGFAREGISHLQVWLNPYTLEGIRKFGSVLSSLDGG